VEYLKLPLLAPGVDESVTDVSENDESDNDSDNTTDDG
jgi:hypothetical protein